MKKKNILFYLKSMLDYMVFNSNHNDLTKIYS